MTANNRAAPVWSTGSGSGQRHQPYHFTTSRTAQALDGLRDAIASTGVQSFASMATLAAAVPSAKPKSSDRPEPDGARRLAS